MTGKAEQCRNAVAYCVIAVFVGTCVFFPYDPWNLKIPMLLLLFFLNIDSFCKAFFKGEWITTFLFGLFFPVTLSIYSYLLTSNAYNALAGAYCGLMLLLNIVIVYDGINYDLLFEWMVLGLAYFIIFLFLADILGIYDVNGSPIRNFIYQYQMGFIGKSPGYALYYKIFLRTSPLVVYLYAKSLYNRKYINMLLCASALLLSGTRMNALAILGVTALFIIRNRDKKSMYYLLIGFFSIAFAIVIKNWQKVMQYVSQFFASAGSMQGDAVRLGHIKGLLEYYRNNPLEFLLGSGLGSSYYSYGSNRYVTSIEWSALDLQRQIGVFFFFIFLLFLFFTIFNRKVSAYKKDACIIYLFVALTNPLLFTSTAYLGFLYVWTDISQEKDSRCQKYGMNQIERMGERRGLSSI